MDNISRYSDLQTANTNLTCATQRAENLFILGARKVLELCVGPSLQRLELEYRKFGISCAGNDIDPRWRDFYPRGKWHIGDALSIDVSGVRHPSICSSFVTRLFWKKRRFSIIR